ncbi:unnamed protein product [Brassica oleracea]
MIHWFKQLRYDQRLASRFYGSFVLFTSLRSTSISLTQSEKWRFYSKTGFSYHHQLLSLSIVFPSSHGALNHYTGSTSRSSSLYLMFFLSVQNVGSAMADVFIDAMIAEALRAELHHSGQQEKTALVVIKPQNYSRCSNNAKEALPTKHGEGFIVKKFI